MRQPPSAAANTAGPGHRAAIDLRRFEPHERWPLLELSLAALDPGETLQATFPRWPAALLPWLQRQHADFTWEAGESGEEWACLRITRREAAGHE